VIPVLLPGATRAQRSLLPLFIKRTTWAELRVIDDPVGLHFLSAAFSAKLRDRRILLGRMANIHAPTPDSTRLAYIMRTSSSAGTHPSIGRSMRSVF
jgi:hypothetical protein